MKWQSWALTTEHGVRRQGDLKYMRVQGGRVARIQTVTVHLLFKKSTESSGAAED